MDIVCLCGSTKFKREYQAAEQRFRELGYLVLTVEAYGHADKLDLTFDNKVKLDGLHREKIRIADKVVFITPNGYMGDSTHAELRFATSYNKTIMMWDTRGKSDNAWLAEQAQRLT